MNNKISWLIRLGCIMGVKGAGLPCITKVLGKQASPAIYEIHTTDKGIPIIVCITNNGTEINVYNLNNNPEGNSMLSLKVSYHGNTCKILNMIGGIRLGHGTLAVERLKHHSKARGYAEVRVQFLAQEKEIALKLKSFLPNVVLNNITLWEECVK